MHSVFRLSFWQLSMFSKDQLPKLRLDTRGCLLKKIGELDDTLPQPIMKTFVVLRLMMYLKLFAFMSIIWCFEVASHFVHLEEFIITDILNCLQGVIPS